MFFFLNDSNSNLVSMPPKAAKPAAAAGAAPAEADSARKCDRFSDAELTELLSIIRARKPIGMDMWKDVESKWNALAATRVGFVQRPALSLKQKFTRMNEVKKPTGDPTMLLLVCLAKQINAEILHEVCVGELEPEAADGSSCPAVDELPTNTMNSSLSELLQRGPEAGTAQDARTEASLRETLTALSPTGSMTSLGKSLQPQQEQTWSVSCNARDSLPVMTETMQQLTKEAAQPAQDTSFNQMIMMQMQMR